MSQQVVQIRLPKRWIEIIDGEVESRYFCSRSEFLKHILRKYMEKIGNKNNNKIADELKDMTPI